MILNILDVIADIVDLRIMRSAEHNRYMFANYSQQIKKANGGPVFLKASDIVTDYPLNHAAKYALFYPACL